MSLADEARRLAQAAATAGDRSGAFRVLEEAARAQRDDAALWNSAGDAGMRAGEATEATACFATATQLSPTNLEYAVNHAIALGRAGQASAALDVLERHAHAGRTDVRYCSVRGGQALALGERGEAARWYDAALALDPAHRRATLGRARVALERAEADAAIQFDRAIAANPADREAWLGKAQALEAAGQDSEARALTQALIEQAPQWIEALRLRAAQLQAAGDADSAQPFAWAAAKVPGDPAIPAAHCETLGALDRFAEAAEVASAARLRFPAVGEFALWEAQNASAAGDNTRAEHLWDALDIRGPERDLAEARHRLRVGDPEQAERLLSRVFADDPWNVAAWALRGVAWRLLADPRSNWLHGQPGLIALLRLPDAEALLPEAVSLLHRLHEGSARPLGQSLRGGTQTRGGLFDRQEPALARLCSAILATLEIYRAQLPPVDPAHPLLRHRDSGWNIAGSWSVRLAGGGDHHTSHIHPLGILSSALYLELPDAVAGDEQEGWLEIGRPACDLRLDLQPLATIRPLAGHLALFPSTMFHGTRPFKQGRRLTVAFDVRAEGGAR